MYKLDLSEDEVYCLLDKCGLTEEKANKSKKVKIMRMIIIYKYIYDMSREEICAELDFISLSTYNRYLLKSLNKLKKYIDM